tara:strand:+ start:479 stop:835 length:357 start_codon:yes stop_codon:yes gene_type:complete
MDTLVSTTWLARHLADPDLVVLDCSVHTDAAEDGIRNTSGLRDYRAGHIPSAGFADLTGDLSDPNSPIEFAPPSPEIFCIAMGRLGVGDDTKRLRCGGSSTWQTCSGTPMPLRSSAHS